MTKAGKLDKHIKISEDYITVQVRKEISASKKEMMASVDMMMY